MIRSALSGVLRRVVDLVPPTPLGLAVAAGAALVLRGLAYAQMDLVLLAAGWGAIGLVALSNVAVILGAVALWARLRGAHRAPGEPVALETGRWSPTERVLPSLGWFPLVQVDWHWERTAAGTHFPVVDVESRRRGDRWIETVNPHERAELSGLRRRAVVSDVFGLARLAVRGDDPTSVRVLPHIGRLGMGATLQSLAGGDEQPHPMGLVDGDRVDLRRYVPGDPARFIHWKVYGRTRKLVVRTPERSLSQSRRTVVFFVPGAEDDPSAAACRRALESGAFGETWMLSADGAGGDTSAPDEALSFVVRAVRHRDRGGEGLSGFLTRADLGGPASLVLFAPPLPGPWLDRVVEAVRGRPRPPRVIVGVDGLYGGPEAPRWLAALAAPSRRPGVPVAAVDRVVQVLSGAGCEVVVHDRVSGRVLGREARRRVAEGARRRRPREPRAA